MSEKSEKCLKKRKYDFKYKSEWASEFAGVVRKAVSKANADLAVARAEEHMMEMKTLERRRAHKEMDRIAVLLELFIL